MNKIITVCFFAAAAAVPLLWFRAPGFVISGDMLPPLTFDGFLNRFFSWDERMGCGAEALLHFSAIFFYFVEAAATSVFPSLVAAQKAEFVFWFLLPGLGFYYFLGVALQGKGREWGRLAGVAFYLFNLYLEPIWQGMNIANLSAYAFVPVMLGLVVEGLENRRPFWFCVLSLALVSFFAAPIGSNPPMLMAAAVPFLVYLALHSAREKLWRSPRRLGRTALFLAASLALVLLIQLFWIVPFIDKVFVNVAATSLEFTAGSARDWLKGLCENTSLLNVARMQGAWTWYAGFGEPYIPYAAAYKLNPFLIAAGFALPALAAAGFFAARGKKEAVFGLTLALAGIVLGAGLHSPTGILYGLLLDWIPGFWTIRSPWYKFTLLTCLGYGLVFGLLGQWLAVRASGRNKAWGVAAAALILLHPFYAYPVTLGKMFLTPAEREWMTHNFMRIPPHAKECLAYLREQPGFFRVFDASPKKLQEYEWGNYGFNHPLTSFTAIPTLYGSMANSPSLYPGDEAVRRLHAAVQKRDAENFKRLLAALNVRFVIFPLDLHWYAMEELKEASAIRQFLEKADGLRWEKQFGPWALYRVAGAQNASAVSWRDDPVEGKDLSVVLGRSEPLKPSRGPGVLLWGHEAEGAAEKAAYKGNARHYSHYLGAEGLLLRFDPQIRSANPTAVLAFSGFEPVPLAPSAYLYIDYELFDPRSCRLEVRVLTEAGETILPALPAIPLGREILERRFPGKPARLLGIELLFSHSFEKRRGFRNYPNKDAVVKKLELRSEPTSAAPSPPEIDSSAAEDRLRVEKINPTCYRVKVNEAGDGALVLSQGIHPRWEARRRGGNTLEKFKADGWANGFRGPFAEGDEIVIAFQNQKRVWRGFAFSGAALLMAAAGWLLCLPRRGRKK